MKDFLHGSGAVVIGLMIAAAFTFPFLIIGIIVGWFYIKEELDGEEED